MLDGALTQRTECGHTHASMCVCVGWAGRGGGGATKDVRAARERPCPHRVAMETATRARTFRAPVNSC